MSSDHSLGVRLLGIGSLNKGLVQLPGCDQQRKSSQRSVLWADVSPVAVRQPPRPVRGIRLPA
jgi:hypothetical protein